MAGSRVGAPCGKLGVHEGTRGEEATVFERLRRGTGRDDGKHGAVASAPPRGDAGTEREREGTRSGVTTRDDVALDAEAADRGRDRELSRDRDRAHDRNLRRREEFGGINWGAAFFGWLVAVGLAALLTAIASGAGTAIGLTSVSDSEAKSNAGTIGIVGGAVLLVILMLAYYCGGYVAGRMSRFDGTRQGIGTWVWGLIITLLLAAAGAIFGSQYNVLSKLNLPRIPVDEGSLATGGAIALAAFVLGTLLAAAVGGKAGQRYHRRVDRYGLN